MRRRRLSRKRSRRSFRAGIRSHRRNRPRRPMRGGLRI